MVMMAAEELDSEAILDKLPWITPEEAEEILKRKAVEDLERFDGEEETKRHGNQQNKKSEEEENAEM